MKASMKLEYACRVLAQLASRRASGKLAHIEELADQEAIPANYLVQILNDLKGAGIVSSKRGKQGGYVLAKTPAEVNLLDIVTAVDGGFQLTTGGSDGAHCDCVTKALEHTENDIRDALARCSLQSIIESNGDPMWYI